MNTTILGGIVFIAVFAGIILLHEFGHFIVAKLLHIEVEEFGFGFPPRIVKLFSWKGTDFTLNWIPLGGFNKLKGENDPGQSGGFAAASPWKRIPVLLAGATMNILTAVFVYTLFFSQVGIPDQHKVVVSLIASGSPAEQAGLKTGDIVLSAGGQAVNNTQQLINITYSSLGKPLPLVIERNGQQLDISVTPRTNPPAGEGPMGVSIGNPIVPAGSWFSTIPTSFETVGSDIDSLLSLPGRIIAGTVTPQEAQIAGPRSIWNLFQQSVSRDVTSREQGSTGSQTPTMPTNYTLLVIISLTLTVGVVNLLPIPALDGWHIFMSLVELVIRKRIPAKYQVAINSIGFLVLVTLLGFFYIKDFINPINIPLP
jgi:regulator of sigma E protease